MVLQRAASWSALLGVLVLGPAPGLGLRSAQAAAQRPERSQRVVPPKTTRKERRAARASRDLSEGGERRGIIELTLGSLTAALSAVLIGRGGWELARAAALEGSCESADPPLECMWDEPARGNRIAGGLSLGFAVPFAVASGFLLARGVRIHRDYRRYERTQGRSALTIAPWGGPAGGGLQLRVRF